jgi:Tol biopolymer transport system component
MHRRPDQEIAFARDGALYTVRPDGTDVRLVTPPDLHAALPDWSPGGGQLVFESTDTTCCSTDDTQAVIANVDGSDVHALNYVKSGAHFPRWSPDGRWISYSTMLPEKPVVDQQSQTVTESGQAVFVVRPDGSGAHQLFADGSNAVWSSDGTRLAFECHSSPYEICVGSADGASAVTVPGTAGFQAPAWSPDGTQLAALSGDKLVHFAPDGSGLTFDQPGYRVWSPTFSGNGEWVAARAVPRSQCPSGTCDDSGAIYLLQLSGTGVRQVTTAGVDKGPAFYRA